MFLNENGEFKDNLTFYIFSDGGPKHFKLKDNLVFMGLISKMKHFSLEYNFFLSYHGFNPCDTAAQHIKLFLERWYMFEQNRRIGSTMRLVEMINDNDWGLNNHKAFFVNVYTQENLSIETLTGIRSFHQIVYSVPQNIDSLIIKIFELSNPIETRLEPINTYHFDSNNFTPIGNNDTRANANFEDYDTLLNIYETIFNQ